MAFITASGKVVSFAEYSDVESRDIRLFETNEVLSEDETVIDDLLVRATERIIAKLSSSNWWRSYFANRTTTSLRTVADIPALDPNYILARQNDFTDLCVYTALAEYILPKIADFGSEDNAERQKMGYYGTKAQALFDELVEAGDWYDFDKSGVISSAEKAPSLTNLKRVR